MPWQGAAVVGPEAARPQRGRWPPSSERTPQALRENTAVLTGAVAPEGTTPIAQAYAGHQFGAYSPRLGDGRALLVGEVIDAQGRRRDLHLKGSGRTPFARGGDGKAAVGPMLREYVIGEAMHALGIPTSRALAVVATGERVHARDAAAGRGARARGGEPHPRRHVPVRGDERRSRARQAARGLLDPAPLPGRGHVPRLLRARRRRAGVARRAVDARRLHPRRHEHGQHVRSRARRSTTARARSWTRSIRARSSARSTTAGATRTATSRTSRRGTWRGSPRRSCRCIDDDTDAAVAAATATLERFPERFNRHWRARHARQAERHRRRADRGVAHAAARTLARLHLDVPLAVGVAAR